MSHIDDLLADIRHSSGIRYPVVLRTGKYFMSEKGIYREWVHNLISVDKDGVPLYSTGLSKEMYMESVGIE